jgi:hypothetical protein
MLRIDQVLKIEAHVIKSAEGPGGIGEALRRVRIDRKTLVTSGKA